VAGALTLESSRRRYRPRDLAVLMPIGDQMAGALENLELRRAAEGRADEQERIRNELQAISAVVMAGVASASDLDAALHSMIKEISARMGWESLAVVLYADDGLLYTRAYYGYPLHSTVVAFVPGQGVIGAVAKSGEGRLSNDVSQDPDYLDIVSETKAEMCVPLYSGGKVIGVLNAESPRAHAFSESDFRILNTLGRQMAIVIERARLADLERSALEKLREADQLKDDFIATVSHELRTPLTSIKGYALTLLARSQQLSSEDRTSFLEVMVRHCDRLARIVDTLLLVSRVEAGEIGGKPAYMGVADLLNDAMEAAGAERRLQIEAEPGIGLITDHFRVHHILRNLFENACKYSPADSPVLVRATVRDGSLDVEVLDQGDGIPEGMEQTIFDRFRRVSDPGRSAVPGTGLGLYIARRFARDMGGDLVVERAEEGGWTGARFTLTLPLDLDPSRSDEMRVSGTGG
jgi:two-component system sensor histidine kinase KdpD